MNPEWRSFLEQAGATITDDLDASFNGESGDTTHNQTLGLLTDLSLMSTLEISGGDAMEFLNGQFTSDIKKLPEGTFQYSAWCNPKGRVIAVFIIYRLGQIYFLLIPTDLKARFLKRLQLYVLRSDVILRDRGEDLVTIGIISDAAIQHFSVVPATHGRVTHEGDLTLLGIDNDPPLRLLVTGPVQAMKSLWRSLQMQFTGIGGCLWQLRDIKTGIPWIRDTTSEMFLPQELNLDIMGGLSYVKGCFPGQEVISRMHYRGNVKQRLHRSTVLVDTPQAAPGEKLYADGTDSSIGTIIHVAGDPRYGYGVLAVADVDKAAGGDLHVAGKSELTLKFEAV